MNTKGRRTTPCFRCPHTPPLLSQQETALGSYSQRHWYYRHRYSTRDFRRKAISRPSSRGLHYNFILRCQLHGGDVYDRSQLRRIHAEAGGHICCLLPLLHCQYSHPSDVLGRRKPTISHRTGVCVSVCLTATRSDNTEC